MLFLSTDKTCEIPLADRTPCVSGGNVSFYDTACQLDSINITRDMCTCPWDEQAWIDNITITCAFQNTIRNKAMQF